MDGIGMLLTSTWARR